MYAIAANITLLIKTGFVVQGHIFQEYINIILKCSII